MSSVKNELAERLAEGGLSTEDAQRYAARLVYLSTRYTKLAVMASEANYDQDDMDAAKEMLREQVWEQVGAINHARAEALEFSRGLFQGWQQTLDAYKLEVAEGREPTTGHDRAHQIELSLNDSEWMDYPGVGPRLRDGVAVKVIDDVEFGFDPRYATVKLKFPSGRANRIDGTWGVAVSEDDLDGIDGDLMLDALNWKESLKDRLAVQGQDPQHLDGIIGKMQAEKVTNLEDSEIERAFEHAVLANFCIRYAKAARDCGLEIDDLFPAAQMDLDIQEQSADDTPSPM